MFKSNFGSSIAPDPKTAGKEAAKEAKKGLEGIKLAFVYASVAYDLAEMLSGIREEMPDAAIIGNTSFTGVVTPQGFIGSDDGFVGVLALAGDADVGVAISAKDGCARETGKKIAMEAMKKAGKNCAPTYYYMVASPGE